MAMKCPRCHAENKDDSKFCGNCGALLGAGDGAGPDAASLTKTLENLLHVLKAGTLVAGKYKIVEEICGSLRDRRTVDYLRNLAQEVGR